MKQKTLDYDREPAAPPLSLLGSLLVGGGAGVGLLLACLLLIQALDWRWPSFLCFPFGACCELYVATQLRGSSAELAGVYVLLAFPLQYVVYAGLLYHASKSRALPRMVYRLKVIHVGLAALSYALYRIMLLLHG